MKICSKCGVSKSLTEFWQTKANKDGLDGRCRTCAASAKRESRNRVKDRNPEEWKQRCGEYRRRHRNKYPKEYFKRQDRNLDLKRNFGITLKEYEAMLDACGHCCLICRLPEKKRSLAVDHDHVTGKIRGLLCSKCNTGIGLLNHSETLLRNAIDYLRKN